ncbi:MAG: GNAT family N-acetyltransferase [Pseudomonadota bacterium]
MFAATGMGGMIRPGTPSDAPAAAAILNRWIDSRDWMPRVHTHAEVEAFYADFVFVQRLVWVVGEPVAGFMAIDDKAAVITALYIATPGRGLGRDFVELAKARHDHLSLWTFVANTGARRFYEREGFQDRRRTPGDNEEGLPDIEYEWERAHA